LRARRRRREVDRRDLPAQRRADRRTQRLVGHAVADPQAILPARADLGPHVAAVLIDQLAEVAPPVDHRIPQQEVAQPQLAPRARPGPPAAAHAGAPPPAPRRAPAASRSRSMPAPMSSSQASTLAASLSPCESPVLE